MVWYRLVSLEKCSGVRPICIGDILIRLVYKVISIVVVNEANRACDTDPLCSGLKNTIEVWGVIIFERYRRRMNLMK